MSSTHPGIVFKGFCPSTLVISTVVFCLIKKEHKFLIHRLKSTFKSLKYKKITAENSKRNNDINTCLKVRTPASILLTVSTSGIESDFTSLSFADEFFLFSWKRTIGATIRTLLCPYFSSVIT
jgi:hypothetical protein